MGKKVFLTEKVELGDNVYSGNAIYDFDINNEQEKRTYEDLLATGNAHVAEFSNLDALENTISTLVAEHQAKKKSIATHRRYENNPAERDYQLDLLEEKLLEDVARAKAEYAKELEVTERELALKSVQAVHGKDEQVAKFIDSTVAQLAYADNPVMEMELLKVKINAFNDEQLATVLNKAGAIKNVIKGNEEAEKIFKEIIAVAKKANKASELDLKLRQLQALKKRKPDIAFQTYQRAKRIREGN